MGRRGTKTVIWPSGGVHKGVGYQQQPPYTCPEASNVCTSDILESRKRGGRRSSLVHAYTTPVAGDPIRFLHQMNTVNNGRFIVSGMAGDIYTTKTGDMAVETNTGLYYNGVRNVQVAEMLQKLYIADYGYVAAQNASDTAGCAGTANGVTITVATGYTNAGLRVGQDIDVYETDGTTLIVSTTIATITPTTTFTLNTTTGKPAGTAIKFKAERTPKVYDPNAATSASVITEWTATDPSYPVPMGCRLMCAYNGRIFLANQPDYPHVWYACRQGDPLDWDYSPTLEDVTRPLYGSSTGDLGQIGEPIKALMPTGQGQLLFGCSNSIWAMRGDIAYGGDMVCISHDVGVVGPNAWCAIGDGSVFFLGSNGLYSVSGGGAPSPWSKDKIPKELIGVNGDTKYVTMCYDPASRRVHIYTTLIASPYTEVSYWLDLDSGAFWPIAINSVARCTSVGLEHQDSGASRVIVGGRDGFLRYYDESSSSINDQVDYVAVSAPSGGMTPANASGNYYPNGITNSRVRYMNDYGYYLFYDPVHTRYYITNALTHGTDYFYNDTNTDIDATYNHNGTYTGHPIVVRVTARSVSGTITLGPFRLGYDDWTEGMLTKLSAILDAGSYSITWSVHVADTAEGAIAEAAHSTGIWSYGRNPPEYVRARGASMCIKLSGTNPWAIENILLEIEQLGLVRAM